MRDFRQLKVWEESHSLTLAIYKTTKLFPKEELFALNDQIDKIRRQLAKLISVIRSGR